MEKLQINLKNCYGIKALKHCFDFATEAKNKTSRAYSIYAPNGIMKTSLSNTFYDLFLGMLPSELRYGLPSVCEIISDGNPIDRNSIYVLKAEVDILNENTSVTKILVDPKKKKRYDSLLLELDSQKNSLLSSLKKSSGLKDPEIETTLLSSLNEKEFSQCLENSQNIDSPDDLSPYKYSLLFDKKALQIINSPSFCEKAVEFSKAYSELFDHKDSLYQRGVFNPIKAETSFNSLHKQGFFKAGHQVHLKDQDKSFNKAELDAKLTELHKSIDSDQKLKTIRKEIGKNASSQALANLLEELSTHQLDYLFENIKPEKQNNFKKALWVYYLKNSKGYESYLETYKKSKDEIKGIEEEAENSAPIWKAAIQIFNNRFVDLPFKLSIKNQKQAVLGRGEATLNFIFKDDSHATKKSINETEKSLSLGEKRALYLLNFIIDVEEKKLNQIETLFILDDVADSFDYKNKHAIIQYLRDLTKVDFFNQIILTHNFDLFRSLAKGNGGFIDRGRCLMATKTENEITLSVAEGIRNYFVSLIKPKVHLNDQFLISSIPFTRNLVEYTSEYKKPESNDRKNYLKLTSLLHWKADTSKILVKDYICIYNHIFRTAHPDNRKERYIDILFKEADHICNQEGHHGIDLESKVVLSIAIRIKAECFMASSIQDCNLSKMRLVDLLDKYKIQHPNNKVAIQVLDKVGITVSSNIHLNSFMYEPIIDLTIDHLTHLYSEILSL